MKALAMSPHDENLVLDFFRRLVVQVLDVTSKALPLRLLFTIFRTLVISRIFAIDKAQIDRAL